MSGPSSMRTPLGRVRNLGSSHSGTTDFWRQRLTAVAMAMLIVPVIVIISILAFVLLSLLTGGRPDYIDTTDLLALATEQGVAPQMAVTAGLVVVRRKARMLVSVVALVTWPWAAISSAV